jgi:hypothetical protein
LRDFVPRNRSKQKPRGTVDLVEHLASPSVDGSGNANTLRRVAMSNRLMISVAAVALIAGAGLANAQGGMKNESGGAATQQSTPSGGGGAASGRENMGPSKAQSAEPEQKSQGAAKGQRAEENVPGAKSKSMSSENETKGGSKEMKTEGHEGQNNNMKAEGREGQNTKGNAETREGQYNRNAEGRETNKNAESREGQMNKNAETREGQGGRSQMTTGQAGAGAKLSSEQRTKIVDVFHREHVQPTNNVDFNIAVGTRIPRGRVHLLPLPSEVVTIYPEWRGYEFILVHDQIVVIDPRTDEIVDVLPA